MSQPVPALVAATLLLLAAAPAQAEPDQVRLSHPADTSQTYEPAAPIEPIKRAVPLLSRDVPAPSYAAPVEPPPTQPEAMPEMDHGGMDHSGMTH